jgi:hypothetical protein
MKVFLYFFAQFHLPNPFPSTDSSFSLALDARDAFDPNCVSVHVVKNFSWVNHDMPSDIGSRQVAF